MSRSSSSACAIAVWSVTSHSVGASAWYASPRARLRRNARWLATSDRSPIVVYSCDQSTDRPSWRHSDSKISTSDSISRSHSSMKLRRLTDSCFFGSGFSGGVKSGSYGSDGSQRTPK